MTLLMMVGALSLCSGSAQGGVLTVADLRLTDNEIPGWVEDTERCAAYDTARLYDVIDGGAPLYIEQGLVEGIRQDFDHVTPAESLNCLLFVDDFGTPVNALNMVNKVRSEQSLSLTVPGFDSTAVIGMEFIGGVFVCAAFDRFYVELSVSGYSALDSALGDARRFLDIFRQKVGIAQALQPVMRQSSGRRRASPGPLPHDILGRRLPRHAFRSAHENSLRQF